MAWRLGAGEGKPLVPSDGSSFRKPCGIHVAEDVLYVVDWERGSVLQFFLDGFCPAAGGVIQCRVVCDSSTDALSPRGVHVVGELALVTDGKRHELMAIPVTTSQHCDKKLGDAPPQAAPAGPADLDNHCECTPALGEPSPDGAVARRGSAELPVLTPAAGAQDASPGPTRLTTPAAADGEAEPSSSGASASTFGEAASSAEGPPLALEGAGALLGLGAARSSAASAGLPRPAGRLDFQRVFASWRQRLSCIRKATALPGLLLEQARAGLLLWLWPWTPRAGAGVATCLGACQVASSAQASGELVASLAAEHPPAGPGGSCEPGPSPAEDPPPHGPDSSCARAAGPAAEPAQSRPGAPEGLAAKLGSVPCSGSRQRACAGDALPDGRGDATDSSSSSCAPPAAAGRLAPAGPEVQADGLHTPSRPVEVRAVGLQTAHGRPLELTGGLHGSRGGVDVRDVRRLPNGQLIDSSGALWAFQRFDKPDQLNEPRGLFYDVREGFLYRRRLGQRARAALPARGAARRDGRGRELGPAGGRAAVRGGGPRRRALRRGQRAGLRAAVPARPRLRQRSRRRGVSRPFSNGNVAPCWRTRFGERPLFRPPALGMMALQKPAQ
ncbi:unnamed protein product [Prorocentrum cordatum]|uniref:Uncharacterized protein n=1 Tax=Prorocentrum cordatum TaxID=2364126 RepID=A0ABN9QLC3_9DINO|nr:unnamed protein product [Polarella glacialis]